MKPKPYTNLPEEIKNGLSFRELIIGFAPSVFGVINRNGQLKPNPQIHKLLKEIKAEIAYLKGLSEDEVAKLDAKKNEEALAEHEAHVKERTELRKKYVDLITQVKNWNTDNAHFALLRETILNNLNSLMENECYISPAWPISVTGDGWVKTRLTGLETDLKTLEKVWKNEHEYIRQLMDFLKDK